MNKTLHVITDELITDRSVIETVTFCLDGGADVIQLRAKTLSRREVFELAVRIREITAGGRALFIVNDYLDIALMVGADGVHLGQEDLPYSDARELVNRVLSSQRAKQHAPKPGSNAIADLNAASFGILGSVSDSLAERKFLIGISAGNLKEAVEAEKRGADYIGFGPVFPTSTKADASAPQGIEELRKVMAAVKTPVVAIGGISLDNIGQVLSAGCTNIAVISAVVAADDPCAAAKALKQKIIES